TTVLENVTIGGAIRKLTADGKFVITFNSGWEHFGTLGVKSHVGQTEFDAGYRAGMYMAANGVTKGICLNHEPGNSGVTLRCSGYKQGLAAGGGTFVAADLIVDEKQSTSIQSSLQSALSRDAAINGVLMTNLDVALAATQLNLPKWSTRGPGAKMLGTFDVSDTGIEKVKDGSIEFLVSQQEFVQAFLPIQLFLLNYVAGVRLTSNLLKSGPALITSKNYQASLCQANRSLPGCSARPPSNLTISLVTYGNWFQDDFWQLARFGALQAAADYGILPENIKLLSTNNFDLTAESRLFNQSISISDAVAVAVPSNTTGFLSGLAAADAMGVPVVTFGEGGSAFDFATQNFARRPLLHIGMIERDVGFEAGLRFARSGGFPSLLHQLGNDMLLNYCNGFQSGLVAGGSQVALIDNTNYAVVSSLNKPSAISQLQSLIATSDADGWFFLTTNVGEFALDSLKTTSKTIRVSGIGQSSTLMAAVRASTISFLVSPQAYLQGYLAVSMLATFKSIGYLIQNDLLQTNFTLSADDASSLAEATCWPNSTEVNPGALCP
ncbi:hypothetical protein HDU67_002816, partial [Dinochytrium kinnereticum]